MSRVEENNKLSIPHHLSSYNDNAMVQIECAKMQYLLDISRSLALIADKMEPGTHYILDVLDQLREDNDGK